MKTIVIYSSTGNTRNVALRLSYVTKLNILEIQAQSNDPNEMNVVLTNIPDISIYDEIILGTPVHGFSMPKITNAYLSKLPDLTNKTFDLFVTHFFPFAWMGGTSTLKQLRKAIEMKHGIVRHELCINWKSKKREQNIEELIARFSS